jgi:hypothetical protein
MTLKSFLNTECYLKDKFYKAGAFVLYPTVDDNTIRWTNKRKPKRKQTDKDGKLVVLYAGNKEAQHSTSRQLKKKDTKYYLTHQLSPLDSKN